MEEVVGKSKKDDTEIGGRHIEPCLGFTARMDTNLKVCGWHSSRTKLKVKTHNTGSVYFWVLHYLLIFKADFWICVSPGHREFIDA